jgi:hypothetical protein
LIRVNKLFVIVIEIVKYVGQHVSNSKRLYPLFLSQRHLSINSVTINMANPEKPELGLLEEDDEFEEFPAEGT